MSAYLVAALSHISDDSLFAQYVDASLPTFAGREVKVLAVCNEPTVAEGTDVPERFVLLEFPDREAAMDWYQSDAYQRIIPLRSASVETPFMVVIDHDAQA